MSVRSAQSVTTLFTTRDPETGDAADADSTPTGTLYVNGTSDAASVTVTNLGTGYYKAAVTLPTLAVGDIVDLRINATVNGVTDNGIIWRDTKDVVIDSAGLVDAKTVKMGPTESAVALTARDIGASVLVGDKTGFSLSGTQVFNNTGTWTGNIVGTVSTLTTYTGNTPQTGDSFARIGAAGAGLTAVVLAGTQTFNNTGTWTGNITGTVGGLTAAGLATMFTVDSTKEYADAIAGSVVREIASNASGGGGGGGLDAVGVRAAVGLASANLDTQLVGIHNKTTNLPASPAAVGSAMTLTMSQAVATSNASNTLGDCLNAARAQGFGNWIRNGNNIEIYAPDGETLVHTFLLDSVLTPTSRATV